MQNHSSLALRARLFTAAVLTMGRDEQNTGRPTVNGDTMVEANETFSRTLSTATERNHLRQRWPRHLNQRRPACSSIAGAESLELRIVVVHGRSANELD